MRIKYPLLSSPGLQIREDDDVPTNIVRTNIRCSAHPDHKSGRTMSLWIYNPKQLSTGFPTRATWCGLKSAAQLTRIANPGGRCPGQYLRIKYPPLHPPGLQIREDYVALDYNPKQLSTKFLTRATPRGLYIRVLQVQAKAFTPVTN